MAFAWPGHAETRDLSTDGMLVGGDVNDAGLFRTPDELTLVSKLLLSGTPPEIPLDIEWRYEAGADEVSLKAQDRRSGTAVSIERVFRPNNDGTWEVEHAWFKLALHQGSGGARRMMRASVEAYDRMAVVYIRVHANLEVGGYAWAKLGFAPDEPAGIRSGLGLALAKNPNHTLLRLAVETAATSSDDELMYNLARLPDDGGRALLKETGWFGHLDLKDDRHRQRLASNFGD